MSSGISDCGMAVIETEADEATTSIAPTVDDINGQSLKTITCEEALGEFVRSYYRAQNQGTMSLETLLGLAYDALGRAANRVAAMAERGVG